MILLPSNKKRWWISSPSIFLFLYVYLFIKCIYKPNIINQVQHIIFIISGEPDILHCSTIATKDSIKNIKAKIVIANITLLIIFVIVLFHTFLLNLISTSLSLFIVVVLFIVFAPFYILLVVVQSLLITYRLYHIII